MTKKHDLSFWPEAFMRTASPTAVRKPTKVDVADVDAARKCLCSHPRAFIRRNGKSWWVTIPGTFDAGFAQKTVADDVVAALIASGHLKAKGDRFVTCL